MPGKPVRMWSVRGPWVAVVMMAMASLSARDALAQAGAVRLGDPVPRDVREIYDAGCRYLARTQDPSGTWKGDNDGPGITGMGLMVFLASGDDPNYGNYREPIRRAVRSIIRSQNEGTGYFGGNRQQGQSSMYHHGFAMLALAEAYGVVDERDLWTEDRSTGKGRLIGESLERAVTLAATSAAANPTGAWRYTPESRDADTSVSGAVMMGLLGARNAGIEVPDATIDKAIKYFTASTAASGLVGYAGPQGGSDATTSIGTLVLSIAHRKDLPQYKRAAEYLVPRSLANQPPQGHVSYTRYYRAQALLQAEPDVWRKWNDGLVQELKKKRLPDGSFPPEPGDGAVSGTCLTLLALAVNYRFLPIYER
ncbi:MAG: prenyltransferase/squalene oxidase repeat-containing protein [Planctomycetia bacterium]